MHFLVPCQPPVNITHKVIDTMTVQVSWDGEPCTDPGARIYVYYQQKDLSVNNVFQWKLVGLNANETHAENAMNVPDLLTAVQYEGYILYSLVGIGNGAPSKMFQFRTNFNREYLRLTRFILKKKC